METVARVLHVRVAHQGCVAVVDGLASDAVVEVDREVESLEREGGAEATVEIRVGVAAVEVRAVGVGRGLGQLACLAVLHVPLGLAFLVDPGVPLKVQGVQRETLSVEIVPIDVACVAVQVGSLVVLVQHRDLVLVVRGVKADAPVEVLLADKAYVEV